MSETAAGVGYTPTSCKDNIPINEIKVVLRCAYEIAAHAGRTLAVKTLKGRKRNMILPLLAKIQKSGGSRFLPLPEYCKNIDCRKGKARIGGVMKVICEGGRGK